MRNKVALWSMYGKMYRAGKRTVRKMLRKGANPYLKMLRDLIDEDSRAECIELGTMDIPTNRIVGITAEEKQNKYSYDFLPLSRPNGDFASKWCKLYWYFFSNKAARCPVTCYEYMGEFYIIDGVKRVSIAKCYGLPTVTASVIRMLPAKTQEESVLRYFDFLEVFEKTGLYQINFTKSGAFAQLQTALGFAPDYVWKEEDRLEFLFNWYEFEQAFQEAFGGYLNVTPADALVVLLEKYNYDTIKKMSRTVLVTLLRSVWKVLYGVHKLNAVSDCQVYQDVQ